MAKQAKQRMNRASIEFVHTDVTPSAWCYLRKAAVAAVYPGLAPQARAANYPPPGTTVNCTVFLTSGAVIG